MDRPASFSVSEFHQGLVINQMFFDSYTKIDGLEESISLVSTHNKTEGSKEGANLKNPIQKSTSDRLLLCTHRSTYRKYVIGAF